MSNQSRRMYMTGQTLLPPQDAGSQKTAAVDCDRCLARDYAELQIRETHHRIANGLQLTSAVMRLQALAAMSEEARAELHCAHRRVESIAIVHRLLCNGRSDRVDLSEYLRTLVEGICGIWERATCRVRLAFRVSPGAMSAERATAIGMIVNELVCNAYKYAFPDGACGEIVIGMDASKALTILEVVDDGVGFAGPGATFRDGLGLRMVDAMTRRLGGSYHREFVTKGTKSVVCFPTVDDLESQSGPFHVASRKGSGAQGRGGVA